MQPYKHKITHFRPSWSFRCELFGYRRDWTWTKWDDTVKQKEGQYILCGHLGLTSRSRYDAGLLERWYKINVAQTLLRPHHRFVIIAQIRNRALLAARTLIHADALPMP